MSKNTTQNDFKQSFTNLEPQYQLIDDELVEIEAIDIQEKLDSVRPDTLTELFDKYMNGEPLPIRNDDGAMYDTTIFPNKKDKIEAAMLHKEVQSTIKKTTRDLKKAGELIEQAKKGLDKENEQTTKNRQVDKKNDKDIKENIDKEGD